MYIKSKKFEMRRFNRILPTGKLFIKNSNLPVCVNCLHMKCNNYNNSDGRVSQRAFRSDWDIIRKVIIYFNCNFDIY